jgi:hypothetical protein
MDTYIKRASDAIKIVDNTSYNLRVGGCSLGGGTPQTPTPKTSIRGQRCFYVYDDKRSITFATCPFSNFAETKAYSYARDKYGYISESDFYDWIASMVPYPSIEDVVKQATKVAARHLRLQEQLEKNSIDRLNQLLCAEGAREGPASWEIMTLVDKIYGEDQSETSF